MKPYCKKCKFFSEASASGWAAPGLPYYAVCTNPELKHHHRIHGPISARLDIPGAKQTTDECDKRGLFEQKAPEVVKRPWWALWETS